MPHIIHKKFAESAERLSKECREYIDKELGLREDYADYMARCFWEVCSPVVNNKWQSMGLYPLDIEYEIRRKLDDAGIDSFGKLCNLTFKELSEIKGIGSQNARRIEEILSKMSLALSK